MPARITHSDYVNQICNYPITVIGDYVNTDTPIRHGCDICGYIWNARPHHIKRGHGCPSCSNVKKVTHTEYVDRIKHKDIVPLKIMKSLNTNILHKCLVCDHEWEPKPLNVLYKSGCPNCYGNIKKTPDDYDEYLRNTNLIAIDDYINRNTKIQHKCLKCDNVFITSPSNIQYGCGCPKCASGKRYSGIAIQWLESFNNPNIQHAENDGEYRIPNSRWKVDGYDPTTNTIYEFLGDKFHGNLDVFDKDIQCHPFSDKTACELHDEWIERKTILEEMGYNVVFIWESDYRNII